MPTSAQFQNLVIASLSAADPTAQIDLVSKVPLYWSLYVLKARWPDIRFWYTYRDAVTLIMGRTRTQIDQVRRNSRSAGDSRADSTTDGNSVAGASTDSTETGRSTLTRGSTRALNGSSSVVGSSSMTSRRLLSSGQRRDDTGSGSGSESSYIIKTDDQLRHHYTIDDTRNQGILHRELASGENTVVDPATNTQTHFAQDKYTSRTRLIEADTFHEHYESINNNSDKKVTGFVQGGSQGGMQVNANGNRVTRGHSAMANSFNANMDESSFATSDPNISKSDGSSSLVEHSSDIGTYSASSALTSRTDTAHSGSGSTTTRDVTTAARESLTMGEAHFQMQKLQQKFLHLDALWKEASARIKVLEQQATITERHQVVQAVTTTVDDYQTSPFALLGGVQLQPFLSPFVFPA